MRPENTCQQTDQGSSSAAVKAAAAELGFNACGIAAAGNIDPDDRLGAWLARGYHADMKWLERDKQVRQDIRLRLPGAKSVVVVARSYYAGETPAPQSLSSLSCCGAGVPPARLQVRDQNCGAGVPPAPLQVRDQNCGAGVPPARLQVRDQNCGAGVPPAPFGRVARYARGRDYHDVLAKPLQALAGRISLMGEDVRCCLSIDTAPVLEKAWAQHAGVGWIGKNGLVLNQRLGSWFFLGVVATTLELAPDQPADDRCATCTRCLDACPTGALVEPRVMDARRCISYLTIERRGPIPADLAQKLGDRLFGCDACQDACPWNNEPELSDEPAFRPAPGSATIDLDELLATDEETFNRRFAGSPIRRRTWQGMRGTAATLLNNKRP